MQAPQVRFGAVTVNLVGDNRMLFTLTGRDAGKGPEITGRHAPDAPINFQHPEKLGDRFVLTLDTSVGQPALMGETPEYVDGKLVDWRINRSPVNSYTVAPLLERVFAEGFRLVDKASLPKAADFLSRLTQFVDAQAPKYESGTTNKVSNQWSALA